jgi:hypothetical protein
MTRPLVVQGMKGLGDGIFQRPFIRAESERRPVYLETPWPQLYSDLPNVFPVKVGTTLRTQAKNAAAQPVEVWHEAPSRADRVAMGYGTRELARGSIFDALSAKLPLHGSPFVFDLPPGHVGTMGGNPYVVVRPVTVRREWHNPARNPDPSAVFKVAQWCQDAGFMVVLVADLKEGHEHAVGALPPHDVAYLGGELDVVELMALVRGAAAVIGGVGWIVPMAIAAGTPLFVVQGGQLGHNGPDKITDRRMNLTRVGWARPRYPCRCERMNHNCRKDPANLRGDFDEWMTRCSLNAPKALSA